MNWFKQNGWAVILVVASIVSNYSINEYRLAALEKHVSEHDQEIATLNSGSVTIQIALARIQVDIDYIKKQVDKSDK